MLRAGTRTFFDKRLDLDSWFTTTNVKRGARLEQCRPFCSCGRGSSFFNALFLLRFQTYKLVESIVVTFIADKPIEAHEN